MQNYPVGKYILKCYSLLDVDTIFEAMDLNHDGRISVIELTKAARYLGYNPTKKEAEQMINDCNPSREYFNP